MHYRAPRSSAPAPDSSPGPTDPRVTNQSDPNARQRDVDYCDDRIAAPGARQPQAERRQDPCSLCSEPVHSKQGGLPLADDRDRRRPDSRGYRLGTGVRALRLRRAAAAIRSRTGRGRVRCRNRCRRDGVPQRNSSPRPPLLLLADVHNVRHPAAPTSAAELAGTTPSSTASPLVCARSQSHPHERRPYPGFPYQTSRRPAST
jgi:hypothetical protein